MVHPRTCKYAAGPLPGPLDRRVLANRRATPWSGAGSSQHTGPQAENIEVISSHFGMANNPMTLHVVADRLAQPKGVWAPYPGLVLSDLVPNQPCATSRSGYARLARLDDESAEVAFGVADTHHKGVGSLLLEHLAAIGLELGVQRFVADVLAENTTMLAVLQTAGFAVRSGRQYGTVSVSFEITPTAQTRAVQQAREHRAESQSVPRRPHPAHGRGNRRQPPTQFGRVQLPAQSPDGRFLGGVRPVHPGRHAGVGGVLTRPGVRERGPVDMAVIAVPAAKVLGVVEECAGKGVRSLVVPSGRFAESGAAGPGVAAAAARAGTAGGNAGGRAGVVWHHQRRPVAPLNASLAQSLPPVGRLGLFAESGTLAIGLLASAERRNLGLSVFASAGNRVDVSSNDLMQYWIDDPATDAVGLYLETIGNPRKFSRIARHLSSVKPVIVVKSGISYYGAPAGLGSRSGVRGVPAEALRGDARPQAGVIRAENMHQMFDIAQLLVHQPLPPATASPSWSTHTPWRR